MCSREVGWLVIIQRSVLQVAKSGIYSKFQEQFLNFSLIELSPAFQMWNQTYWYENI